MTYYNVFGEKVRPDLFKMGLLTAAGMLVAKRGLSARAYAQSPGSNQLCLPGNQAASPSTRAFVERLPIMPIAQTVPSLTFLTTRVDSAGYRGSGLRGGTKQIDCRVH